MDYNVPIIDVIYKLWIQFKKYVWNEYKFIEYWQVCDWRAFNTTKNQAYDFAGKWRASWWPYKFVRDYLNLSAEDTKQRFIDNFNLHPTPKINEARRIKAKIFGTPRVGWGP